MGRHHCCGSTRAPSESYWNQERAPQPRAMLQRRPVDRLAAAAPACTTRGCRPDEGTRQSPLRGAGLCSGENQRQALRQVLSTQLPRRTGAPCKLATGGGSRTLLGVDRLERPRWRPQAEQPNQARDSVHRAHQRDAPALGARPAPRSTGAAARPCLAQTAGGASPARRSCSQPRGRVG